MNNQTPHPVIGNDTEAIARSLKIELQPAPHGFVALCPFEDHQDSNPSFFVYKEHGQDNGFYCFGCNRGGDGIGLLSLVKGISRMEATAQVFAGNDTQVLLSRMRKYAPQEWQDPSLLVAYLQVNSWLRWLANRMPVEQWREFARKTDEGFQSEEHDLTGHIVIGRVYEAITTYADTLEKGGQVDGNM